jgi:hypothetical protein
VPQPQPLDARVRGKSLQQHARQVNPGSRTKQCLTWVRECSRVHPGRHDDPGLEQAFERVRDELLHADDHRVWTDQVLGMRPGESGVGHPGHAVRGGVVETVLGLDKHVEAH